MRMITVTIEIDDEMPLNWGKNTLAKHSEQEQEAQREIDRRLGRVTSERESGKEGRCESDRGIDWQEGENDVRGTDEREGFVEEKQNNIPFRGRPFNFEPCCCRCLLP